MSDAKKKGGGKKRIIMLAAVVLLAGGGGAAAWFGGFLSHAGKHAKPEAVAVEKPSLVDLPDMVSNLDTGGHRPSFVKVHIKLEVQHASDAAAIQAAEPELLDIVQTYLREMRPEELHGGEATYRLRESLMNRIDAKLAPIVVTDLLFTQLLVQ